MFLLQHLVDSLQQLPFRSTNITGGLTNSYPTCCLDYQRNILSISALLPPANEVCEGNVFTDVCLSTWGSLFRGVSVQGVSIRGVSVQGSSVQGGLYPGEGSLSRGRVSIQGKGLYPGKGLCPGERSLSRGRVSVQGGSLSGRPPYGNVRVVRILLECILISSSHYLSEFFHQYDEINKANKGKYLISAEFEKRLNRNEDRIHQAEILLHAHFIDWCALFILILINHRTVNYHLR